MSLSNRDANGKVHNKLNRFRFIIQNDVQDHLTSVTDGEGNTTSYTYLDRDLLTKKSSPVSGVTSYSYDEHGELISETDARGVTVLRIVDALDRVTFVDYPDDALDISFTYDDPSVAFSKGRLTQILRDGHAVDYEYDRFGRTTRDGDLQILFDKNGNRVEIGYPGGVSALYTFDFADREKTLDVEIPGFGVEPWVTDASYYASGPLQLLDFANGVQETRTHDQRYFPDQILATGPSSTLLLWQYTTDDVGNITLIYDLQSPSDRSYGYQDYQYFLTWGNGPWGNLSWSYDKIGNRLSETRDGVTDTYSYVPGVSGNNPKLSQISLGSGGTEIFSYDAIGSQTQIVTASEITDYIYGDDKRLIAIALASGEARTDFEYDGRSFLRSSVPSRPVEVFADGFESGDLSCWTNSVGGPVGGTCPSGPRTEPTYSSEGLLMHLRHDGGARDRYVFYFAGRPVGILGLGAGAPSRMVVTSDHLGTPVLVTDETGGAGWDGGFEPFGADFSGAQDAEMFLRFPGQWEGEFQLKELARYYNLQRWYDHTTGRYIKVDPVGIVNPNTVIPNLPFGSRIEMTYGYAEMNPLGRVDPLGLRSRVCCRGLAGGALGGAAHCFIETENDGGTSTCSLIRTREKGKAYIHRGPNDFDDPGKSQCGPWNESCDTDQCVVATSNDYANPSEYHFLGGSRGANSNTFAGYIARNCGLTRPMGVWAPGWDRKTLAVPKPGEPQRPSPCRIP